MDVKPKQLEESNATDDLLPMRLSALSVFVFVVLFAIGQVCCAADVARPVHIAHAGGRINGMDYTNSRQAFDLSYEKGFRFFEVDISWTSDNRLVLLHDWGREFKRHFDFHETKCEEGSLMTFVISSVRKMAHKITSGEDILSLCEFMSASMKGGLQQMDIDDLFSWMRDHDDAIIITDVKRNNLEALEVIAKGNEWVMNRIIPQIYSVKEYKKVRKLGYNKVIFTLYKTRITRHDLLAFVEQSDLLAVATFARRLSPSLVNELQKEKVGIYGYVVNSEEEWDALKEIGVTGVYTDVIAP